MQGNTCKITGFNNVFDTLRKTPCVSDAYVYWFVHCMVSLLGIILLFTSY